MPKTINEAVKAVTKATRLMPVDSWADPGPSGIGLGLGDLAWCPCAVAVAVAVAVAGSGTVVVLFIAAGFAGGCVPLLHSTFPFSR